MGTDLFFATTEKNGVGFIFVTNYFRSGAVITRDFVMTVSDDKQLRGDQDLLS